jgi:hypothetical protein
MRRREFIALAGGMAAAWPLLARAQQTTMPLIGFLGPPTPEALVDRLRGFREDLKQTGFVEGESLDRLIAAVNSSAAQGFCRFQGAHTASTINPQPAG